MGIVPRLALVTCKVLPEPDPDAKLLLDACVSAGYEAEYAAWDDETVDWNLFDLAVIRSTWNYFERPAEFGEWVKQASNATTLYNSADTVLRNMHKSYLIEMERLGIPIVPTKFFTSRSESEPPPSRQSAPPPPLATLQGKEGWEDIVIKPAVSAASYMTKRFTRDRFHEADSFLKSILRDRDAMVQPYLASIESGGEVSLIYLGGEFSHGIVKHPRFHGQAEVWPEASVPHPSQKAIADKVMETMREPWLYARVDLMQGNDGDWLLSELEMIEPSLYFAQHPSALGRFVAALAGLGTLKAPK